MIGWVGPMCSMPGMDALRRFPHHRCVMRLAAGLLLIAAACSSPPPSADATAQHVRCRIAGRGEEPSITSAAYRIYLVLQGPGGRRESVCLHVPEHAESESVCGQLSVLAEQLCGLPDVPVVESRHGAPALVHDLVLPPGLAIDFRPGAYFVCRRVGATDRFVAEADAEIAFGLLAADGASYDEVAPGTGGEATFEQAPPGWPPAAR